MNPTIDVLMKRKSTRAYEARQISADVRTEILKATLRAPTAGNMMLYSIVDVIDLKYWWYTAARETYAPKGGENLAPRQQLREWKGSNRRNGARICF